MSLIDHEQDELSGQRFKGQVFGRLLPYLRPQLKTFAFSLVLVFGVTAVALYNPLLLGRIVDQALVKHDTHALWRLVLLFCSIEVARISMNFAQSILLQRVGQHIMHAIRTDLFSRLLRMPVPFFDQNPVGRLVTRVTNDTSNLSELFNASFISFLSDIALIFGILAIMVAVNWRLGLWGISVFPLMVAFMVYFSKHLRRSFRGSRRALALVNGYFAERVGGMPIIQMMGREDYERRRYEALSIEYRTRQFDSVHLYSLFHPAITILSAVSMIFVIFFGAKAVQSGQLPLGTFVAFLAYVQALYNPVRSITDKYNIYLAAMASAERIFSLLDMPEEEGLREPIPSVRAKQMRGELIFKNVNFRYMSYDQGSGHTPSRPQALVDVSFCIKPGEHIAVVGATGAGKSTLAALLLRFYEAQSGEILFDGKPLNQIDKRELRSRIGFVQQDVFVFAGTIRENLLLLAPHASDERILEVAALSGFSDILAQLPKGLDTILDERGANLSLGERQILAVTRMLLEDPELLILDEATASVDATSEAKIQSATKQLIQGRTALIIAHRLSTVQHVDRIFVFHQGQLIEAGSHNELLTQNGAYARLLKLQEAF